MQTKGFVLIPILVALQVLALAYSTLLEDWVLDKNSYTQMGIYLTQQQQAQNCIREAIARLPESTACLSVQQQVVTAAPTEEQYWHLEVAYPATRVFVKCSADRQDRKIVGWQSAGSLSQQASQR